MKLYSIDLNIKVSIFSIIFPLMSLVYTYHSSWIYSKEQSGDEIIITYGKAEHFTITPDKGSQKNTSTKSIKNHRYVSCHELVTA